MEQIGLKHEFFSSLAISQLPKLASRLMKGTVECDLYIHMKDPSRALRTKITERISEHIHCGCAY